jgi:hypothetical protein
MDEMALDGVLGDRADPDLLCSFHDRGRVKSEKDLDL